jgi:hypothetical protein
MEQKRIAPNFLLGPDASPAALRAVRSFLFLGSLLLAACSLEKEVSRVAVPESNMTLVLTEDEKQMFRYHVLVNGEEAGEPGFLGPHDFEVPVKPLVTVDGHQVVFTWRGHLITQFVAFDVVACQVRDSRGGTPQKVPMCSYSRDGKQM